FDSRRDFCDRPDFCPHARGIWSRAHGRRQSRGGNADSLDRYLRSRAVDGLRRRELRRARPAHLLVCRAFDRLLRQSPSPSPHLVAMAGEMTESVLNVGVVLERTRHANPKFVLEADLAFLPGPTIIFGPSGAGKSTLLDCIAGLLKPQKGKIDLSGDTLFDTETNVNLRPEHRHVGYVFQSLALCPHMTVHRHATYGLANLPAEQQNMRSEEILTAFHIEALRSRKPSELSGGEQQRVALARSLVTQPRVLLLDEPMTGLDAELKASIINDLLAWNASHRIPILYVTHSREEAAAMGGRMVFLKNGKVVA